MITNYDQLDTNQKCQLICAWIDYLEGSQKAFAEKLNIHANTTTQWRSGRQSPGRDTVNLVLKTYEMNMAEYMAGPPKYPSKGPTTQSFTIPIDYARILSQLEAEHKLPSPALLCAMIKVFNDWTVGAQRAFLARYFQILGAELEEKEGQNPKENTPPADEKCDQERE